MQLSLYSQETIELERIARRNPVSPKLLMSQQERKHRVLQEHVPRELKDLGWTLFYHPRDKYSCICFLPNGPLTQHYRSKEQAIEEAHKYSIVYELYPNDLLQLVHPKRFIPNEYRELLIQHEVYNRRLPPERPGMF